MKRIPFCDLSKLNRPMMAEIERALLRVARSGRYVGGTEVSAFEEKLCRLTGAEYAVGTGNGLDALKLIMLAWVETGRLCRGDGVVVAANTYVASLMAIEAAGLVPVPVDPDRRTMVLGADGIKRCRDKSVKAVMPVHLYGRADWDAEMVAEIAGRGLLVVEDNAQAIGAQAQTAGLNGRHSMTGCLGDAGAVSFYPTKNIGAFGDAGVVLTDDAGLADAVRALSNYGSDRRYHNIYAGGCNSRLDPLQAAVLNVKLDYLGRMTERRRKVAMLYDSMIDNPHVERPQMPDMAESHVWHQYVVGVAERGSFRRHMLEHGIETDVHYAVAPHRQPCYAGRLWVSGSFGITDGIAGRVVSLPIATVTDEEAAIVAETVNSWHPS